MKKTFTLLAALLCLAASAKADELTIDMSTGTLTRGGQTGQNYNNAWTANAEPTFTLSCGTINNMARASLYTGYSSSTLLSLHSGSAGSSTYTLTAPGGYEITAYSITGQGRTATQTITPAGKAAITFSMGTMQTGTVTLDTPAKTASFVQTGNNASGLVCRITVTYNRLASPTLDTPVQGYQTTGRGSEALLLRASLTTASQAVTPGLLGVTLSSGTEQQVSHVRAYLTPAGEKEFFAATRTPAGTAAVNGTAVEIDLSSAGSLEAATEYNLWLTAQVKTDATVGESIDAAVRSLAYTNADASTGSISVNLNPEGEAKIFKLQRFVYAPTTHDCRFYRIPALIRAQDNSLVAVADKRYNSNADLHNHKIDVVARRSTDGGQTWSAPNVFAIGDGSSLETYGFGDAALAVAPSGKIICLMAAGQNGFFAGGLRQIYMCTSDDNGQNWSAPVAITGADRFTDEVMGRQGLGCWSVFVTSGEGLTTKDGRVMFLANIKRTSDTSPECYILYTDDEGENWTLAREMVYGPDGDESKLVQRPDGSILASIRQSGQRGFNIGGTDGLRWMGQTRNATLSGNYCNADLIVYNNELIIHSILTDTGSRRNLRLFASRDQGITWSEAYTIQTGGSAYSVLEKLDNGDLAILFEDESYSAGNGYAINYLTIPAETVENWGTAVPATVLIANNTLTGPDTYGTTPSWDTSWTSNSNSGCAGLVVSTNGAKFNRGNLQNARVLAIQAAQPNQPQTITLTAPGGYHITGYEIGGYCFNASETYTLASEGGSPVTVNTTTSGGATPNISANGLQVKSTSFTFTATGTTQWMAVPWFRVFLGAGDAEPVADTGYAPYVESEIKPYFTTAVGQYFGLSESVKNAQQATYEGALQHCTIEEYLNLRDAVKEGLRYPETGHYRLKNNLYNNYMGAASNLGSQTAGLALTNIVKMEKHATDNTYALKVQGQYIQTPARSTQVTLGDSPVFFTPVVNAAGTVALTANPANTYAAIHIDAQAKLVGWTVESSSTASQWTVEDATEATLTTNILGGKAYATLYTPFAYDLPAGVTAYTGEVQDDVLQMTAISGTVPAATPVVLVNESADLSTVELTLSGQDGTPVGSDLSGTYLQMAWDAANGLALGKSEDQVGFYKWNGTTLGANRAYVANAPSGIKGMAFRFGDGTTALLPLAEANADDDTLRYNAAGQRVSASYRGLVIRKGQKTVQ